MFRFDFVNMLLAIPGILIGLTFHEFAHAAVSDRLGDPTPRNQGRLTLSPLPHIDIIGFLFILVLGFGWAKPVQVNPRYYKNPRRDDMLVSAAGPFMNLLLAVIFAVLLKLTFSTGAAGGAMYRNLQIILFNGALINVMLMVLNLIPVPPLDGFHILSGFIPYRYRNLVYTLERYGTIILILIIITPAVDYIIGVPRSAITNVIFSLLNIPVRI